MKLSKRLNISNKTYPLISAEVKIHLCDAGRAKFIVRADKKLSGIVIFSLAYSNTRENFFIGYIESTTTVDSKQQLLFCRELSHMLQNEVTLSLRHATLSDVLEKLHEQTELDFDFNENADYATNVATHFNLNGSGFLCLKTLAKVFSIKDFIWKQNKNGAIFVGSWNDSIYAKRIISIDAAFITQQTSCNTCTIPVLPQLRAGMKFENGVIQSVHLLDDKMVIEWM